MAYMEIWNKMWNNKVKMHWRLMFPPCTPLLSQPTSFVGLCHSLICCTVSSQVVWLSLKNYHSYQLSQVMVSSEFRKSSRQPLLCSVECAGHCCQAPWVLVLQFWTKEAVSSYFWPFLLGKCTAHSPWVYLLRGVLSISPRNWGVLVVITSYCFCNPYSRANSVSAFHSSLVAENTLLLHKLTRITKLSSRTDCPKRFNISLILFYLLVETEWFGRINDFSKCCGVFSALLVIFFPVGFCGFMPYFYVF